MTMLACALLLAARLIGEVPTTAPAGNVLRLGAVTVDRAGRSATIPARVVKPGYMLEFLLCRTGTKEYESVLATDARPHEIHAALLLLGLSPGLPAETVGETFYPPRGAKVAVELHWTDQAGKQQTASAGDWLAPSETAKGKSDAPKPARWVFVGSELMPGGGYAADQDGGIIAVANVAAAVLDVPMASTKILQQRRYVLNADACPPVGTDVQIVLRPDKNAERAPYARALLEIDPNGEMAVDGLPITMGKLAAWADAFSTRHKRGRVVIRSAAETPAGLAPEAQSELKLGGVYDFEFRVAPAFPPLLPRTDAQLEAATREWRERFAHPEDQLDDPGKMAEDVLKQIEASRENLQRIDALWARYAEFLRTRRESRK